MLIAQRVSEMRRGTCRPSFGEWDEPGDQGSEKESRAAGSGLGQPKDVPNADGLQPRALL